MKIIIFGDHAIQHLGARVGIARTTGAHRVATLLRKQGLDVEVVDFFHSYTVKEIVEILGTYSPDDLLMVGFSASITNYSLIKTDALVTYIRKYFPNTKIVVGGTNVVPKNVNNADLYLDGFAEEAIGDLISFLFDKPHNFNIELAGSKKIVDCTIDYPLTDTSKLETIYTTGDFISPGESLVIEFSRGCIFNCKFCDFPLINKEKDDYIREEEPILKEMMRNYELYGTTSYIISDDTFNDNIVKIKRLHSISKKLPFKLTLMGFVRVDLMHTKPSTLEMMVDAGFKAMHFGVETFHPETSKLIGKGFNGSKLKPYLKEIKNKFPNLFLHGSFIIGLPNESKEYLDDTFTEIDTDRLLDCWVSYSLTIPVKDKFIRSSYFTNNWLMYGYKKIGQTISHITWSNKHFDESTASEFSTHINTKTYKNRKINPWNVFTMTAIGYDIDNTMLLNRNELDINDIKSKTALFVETYKQKKFQYIKQKNTII
jgi:radical SAM superfamily enzyme YgiQ (UPF0313 family)